MQTIKYNNKQLYSSHEHLVSELPIKFIGKLFHQFVAFDRKNFLLKDRLYQKMFAKLAGFLVWYELCHLNLICRFNNKQ